MKILVTGGAGFIGSHTCDRLLALGHEVVVLDALTPPVHRDGRPVYLSPGADFYQGDTRNRDLLTNLLRRVDAVYHFAAYQDYLPDFSRFSDVNVVSTALIYEIIVAERLDMARVVVASSQSAMGEGLYRCPADGEQLPGMRPESALAAGQWDIPCPVCGGPLEMQATPERISNPQNAYGMSKLGEEMVAVNLGRRYGIPTVALRYSIVQGPRQSVYNAYSGACRIFCLSYLQGMAPTLYEDGGAIRDYVNIDDVVDANVLVLEDDRAAGRVFNVGGGKAVTTREFADIVMRQYGSAEPGSGDRRVPLRRHAPHPLGHQRPPGAGLGAAAYAGRLGRGVRRVAQGHGRPRRRAGRGERADACPGSGPEGWSVKAFLLAAGVGSRLRPITDTIPKCMVAIDGRPLLDIWLDAFDRAGVDEVLVNLHHLPDVVRRHLAARTGPPAVRTVFEPELLGSAGTLAANRRLGRRGRVLPGLQRRQPHGFRSAVAGRGPPAARRDRDTDGLPFRTAVGRGCRGDSTPPAGSSGSRRSRANPVSDLTNAGMYAFHPSVLDEIDGVPPKDIGYDLLPRLVGRARAVLVEGYFRDIGTADAYRRAREEWPVRASR